ncbi:MAG: hypothetical protein PHD47_02495 [Acholeplasmataceae bacterium]|nr:hypothetical protein [Acholeplasmataceae bacterium]
MTKLSKASFVLIDNQEINIGEFVEKLVNLPADATVDFFKEIGLMIPREIRIRVLKTVLNPSVKNKMIVEDNLSDEVQYRLGWYDNFSETQLINLLPQFNDDNLINKYLDELWLNLLSYIVSKKVSESDTLKLYELSQKYQYEPFFDVKDFNKKIDVLFYDNPDEIDGLSVDVFRPVLFKSSTTVEIREIGEKYGVKVPRRIKKQELVEIIKQELNDRNQLTPDEEAKIDKMSVIPLQRYAIDHDIKASIELKKEEIIEYIIKNAKETKEKYFMPDNPGIYESIQSSNSTEPLTEPQKEEIGHSEEKPILVEPEEDKTSQLVESTDSVQEKTDVLEEILEEAFTPHSDKEELFKLEEKFLGSDAELLEKIVDLEIENKKLKDLLKESQALHVKEDSETLTLSATHHVHEHHHYHHYMDEDTHECHCHEEHDHDHNHPHDHKTEIDIHLEDLSDKEPVILFPFKTTVTQKQFSQIKENEAKNIKNRKRKLSKLEPVPVSFIDSE